MKQFLACLLTFMLACPGLWAQKQPDEKHTQSIKKKVANCIDNQRAVAIETYDGRHLQGSIGEAGTDSFVLSFKLQNTTLAYSDVRDSSPLRLLPAAYSRWLFLLAARATELRGPSWRGSGTPLPMFCASIHSNRVTRRVGVCLGSFVTSDTGEFRRNEKEKTKVVGWKRANHI
jgi:hypothetical protein